MEKFQLNQISSWIRFMIQVCLIPFSIYVVHSLETLNKQTDLMYYQLNTQISKLLDDHEQRLRILEHQRIAEEGKTLNHGS